MFSSPYDAQLASIRHYQHYPMLYPWIGEQYQRQAVKILIVGESHYLKDGTSHHDEQAWYAGISTNAIPGIGWANTRKVVGNGVNERWLAHGKAKVMYRHIEDVLREAEGEREDQTSPFHRIAYMNYFQRPAEKLGKSITIKPRDRICSAAVLNAVIGIIEPKLVVFCSVLAWKTAKGDGVFKLPDNPTVRFAVVAHPTTSWWNRPMAKYNGKRGRDMLLEAVKSA